MKSDEEKRKAKGRRQPMGGERPSQKPWWWGNTYNGDAIHASAAQQPTIGARANNSRLEDSTTTPAVDERRIN
jgi:hypothetical protein